MGACWAQIGKEKNERTSKMITKNKWAIDRTRRHDLEDRRATTKGILHYFVFCLGSSTTIDNFDTSLCICISLVVNDSVDAYFFPSNRFYPSPQRQQKSCPIVTQWQLIYTSCLWAISIQQRRQLRSTVDWRQAPFQTLYHTSSIIAWGHSWTAFFYQRPVTSRHSSKSPSILPSVFILRSRV